MTIYTLTTGADSYTSGANDTYLGTAQTINAGDTILGTGATIMVSGGGTVDFSHVQMNIGRGGPTIVLDGTPTAVNLSGVWGTFVPGTGADTFFGQPSFCTIAYTSQQQIDGDTVAFANNTTSGTISITGNADLTHFASLTSVGKLVASPDAVLTVNDQTLKGILSLSSTGNVTLLAASDHLDLTSTQFGIGTASVLGQSHINTTFVIGYSDYGLAITGNGDDDVLQIANAMPIDSLHLTGIEHLAVDGVGILRQSDIDAFQTITGIAPGGNAIQIAGGSGDLSHAALSGIGSITAGSTEAVHVLLPGHSMAVTTASFNDTIDGGAGNDSISSGAGNDLVRAGDGNDLIQSGLGTDTIYGGAGADILKGTAAELDGDTFADFAASGGKQIIVTDGTAASSVSYANGDIVVDPDGFGGMAAITVHLGSPVPGTVFAQMGSDGLVLDFVPAPVPTPGNDTLTGATGADTIDGQTGDDFISGQGGNDSLSGSGGNDTILGGEGNDTVMGLADNDSVLGGEGDDLARGGNGNDYVDGGAGNDAIWGDPGNDTLVGGAGADRFFFIAGYGNDRVLDFTYADGDRIRLDKALSVATIADDTHGDAVITTNDGSTITLVGHHASDVQSGWIGL